MGLHSKKNGKKGQLNLMHNFNKSYYMLKQRKGEGNKVEYGRLVDLRVKYINKKKTQREDSFSGKEFRRKELQEEESKEKKIK